MRRVRFWGAVAALGFVGAGLSLAWIRERGAEEDTPSARQGRPNSSAARCSKTAAAAGSDANPGTTAKPYATVEKLANSLRPGQTGCVGAGVHEGDVKIARGGAAGAPTRIVSAPGTRATIRGRIHVADQANHVMVEGLDLDGRNPKRLPSPTINGDHVEFRDNDVTNRNTTICFLVGSDEYGRARDTVIERNRIHNCGQLPPDNHHHGIYVEASDRARIVGNWIYDNADRGVQLFPDAQDTYIARNVIDGNGQGVLFSYDSSGNVVEHNVISNPAVRYNVESFDTRAGGNVVRRNCVWSARHAGRAGIQPDIEARTVENLVARPRYVDRDRKDFRLRPGSPCSKLTEISRREPPPDAAGRPPDE